MTTPAAELAYRTMHEMQYHGKPLAVHNPNNVPLETLPIIFGFNNGGSGSIWYADLISQDGESLGSHICSHESYMPHDLGCIEGTRPDRHETFKKHYPEGYRMEFISHKDVPNTPLLLKAFELNKEKYDV